MKYKTSIALLLFLLIVSLNNLNAQFSVRFEIAYLPSVAISSDEKIYLAGTFNGWNPEFEACSFKKNEQGDFILELQLPPGTYEYKLTRGSWEKTECKANGMGLSNRVSVISSDTSIALTVEAWQDQFISSPPASTASSQVCILDTAFLIPQLKRERRVWIYLPYDYCDGSNKQYPVLYIHDGQNVFDNRTSFSGEWGVDELLDSTRLDLIVVAVDNGGNKRLNEYNPYDHEQYGKGEGDAYVDFIVKTLKPFIDQHFRTVKGKRKSYIAGSSMGGLISMYAVLKYPKVFGGAGIFSPAFWIGPDIINSIRKKGGKVKSRIYFYAGKQENESMVPDMLKAFEAMSAVSKSKLRASIKNDGKHNEASWRNEMPEFFKWIADTDSATGN